MRNTYTTALAVVISSMFCGANSLYATTSTLQAKKSTSSVALGIMSHIDTLDVDAGSTAPKPSLADYISRQLRESGAQVGGTANSYYQPIQIPTGADWDPQANSLGSLTMSGQRTAFQPGRDFQPLGFSASASGAAEVVFAGYGLTIPGPELPVYDSYKDVDLNGKAVLILDGVPAEPDSDKRLISDGYADLYYKAVQARERGAVAVFVVAGGQSLIPVETHAHAGDVNIPAFSITSATADKLLAMAGRTLRQAATKPGFLIPGLRLEFGASVERTGSTRRNILATIPPQNGASDYILLGTRYGPESTTQTAVALEIVRTLAADRATTTAPRRGIILAFWHDTPTGTAAAEAWIQNPTVSLQSIAAYINLDAVSAGDKLIVQGTGSAFNWNTIVSDATETSSLQVTRHEMPYLPTDVAPFTSNKIPVLNVCAGMGDEDVSTEQGDTAVFEQLHDIILALLTGTLGDPSTSLDYIQVEHTGVVEARDGVRVSLGTAPDYEARVTGVKLAGVRPGSPAHKGGLRPGDIIVSIGGKAIVNIYDYTYTLDTLEPGEPIEVTVTRNNTSQTLTITPEPRG